MGGGPSVRSGTGRGTVGEVQNLLGDRWGGPGMAGGPSERSGMGWEALGEVWDRLLDS